MAFVGKMDRQTKILKKRQQRHSRQTSARIAQFISHYIQHKYNNIHTEAKEFYDRLKAIYPYKHDLRKTAEYDIWKKETAKTNTATKGMELKIPLMNYKPKRTTTTTTVQDINDDATNTTEIIEQDSDGTNTTEIIEQDSDATNTTEIMEQDSDGTNTTEIIEQDSNATNTTEIIEQDSNATNTAEIIEQDSNATNTTEIMEQDICSSLDLQIPPETLEQIIADIQIDSFLTDFETLGSDIHIDEQYSLEDELAKYYY